VLLCESLADDCSLGLWAHGEGEEGLGVGTCVVVTPYGILLVWTW
jgi:hypothetical protein